MLSLFAEVLTHGGQTRQRHHRGAAASAAIAHMGSWWHGTTEGEWVSMAVPSGGEYGVPEGLMFSYPVTIKDGVYQILDGLEHGDLAKQKLQATADDLAKKRDVVKDLLSPGAPP